MITQNKENAKVTIVIPIYKVAAYIADCLRSVYAQTYPQLEVILVNDATPDDSMEQAASWIDKLRERFEVKVVNHEHNRGLSAARNTGIKEATGGWIYFLDSDDEITPDCIELMVKEVEKHPDVDFVIGGVKVEGGNWKYPLLCGTYIDNNQEILQDYVAEKWYVMACNILYRKTYLLQNELWFREGLLHEDLLFSFQVANTARTMAAVHADTYIYKVRSVGSISTHLKSKNFKDILEINKEKIKYILLEYENNNFIIPFSYCLDIIYGYECRLVENKIIGLREKINFLNSIKRIYAPTKKYKSKMLNTKYNFLFLIQELPSVLIYCFVKMRLFCNCRK